jgi:hypothetical protein
VAFLSVQDQEGIVVFTHRSSTTGRGALRRRLIGVAGATATVAVIGALTLAAPLSASAADQPESYAKGQFLSGSVLGTDLGKVLRLQYAEAQNDGTQGTRNDSDPLKVTALNSLQVGSGQTVNLPLGDFLHLGAAEQVAQANGDGSSMGASGAVDDDGGLAVSGGSVPNANATFDLQKLLGSQFASTLADLKLQLGAIAASAHGDLNQASGSYKLADAKLTFTSPAVAQLTQKVDAALDGVNTDLGSITGQGGDLVTRLNQLLPLSGSGLNLLGNGVSVNATIDTGDLKAAVQDLLTSEFKTAGVDVNLETGSVSLDLAKLVGGNLNGLAPGTELVNDKIIGQVLDSITSQVASISDQVIAKVKQLLNAAKVTITAHADVSVAQAPIVNNVCHVVQQLIPGASGSGSGTTGSTAGSGSGDPVGGLLGGLLGGVSGALNAGSGGSTGGAVGGVVGGVVGQVGGAVGQIVDTTVCNKVATAVPAKLTSLDVNISGSAKQLIDGGSTTAGITLSVLGIPTTVNTTAVLQGLGGTLSDQLFGTDGTISKLTSALQSGLVQPAVTGLVGPGTGPVSDALTKLLSVKVNLQETTAAGSHGMAAQAGKMFTETAVRVTVLGGAGASSLATVNLAQAVVGPNITTVVNPPTCTGTTCDPATCTIAPCGPNTNPPGFTQAANRLASTGLSIGALVAAMLALLAAGAYLVREGYKRRRLTPVI